ncbi:ABC transporter ATP-binding protein [Clostridium tunisiense]|uniref:ABC transporter ATP-binding protein n=1 Tax=Clostridium tunisiense TaxID=219748 RepID=UPI00030A5109|nr:ABC transporter ATP-binding protein [Clostridium tunisiense]
MGTVLEVKDIHKSLGGRKIIKGVTFEVKEGEIFGFLGANGAGKTTTIRMLVGLIKPDSGSITIMGHDIQKDLVKALRQVGAIVENPDLYKDLTGRENLKVFARMYGKVSKEKIEEVIDTIGLKERIDDKVKKYSLGMKQRLGLGQALLCSPKLLILDEPTNGLDPVGIYEFRNIVRKLARENNTAVFISSHILAEIEQICDRVAFVQSGTISAVEELSNLTKEDTLDRISIVTHERDKCKKELTKLPFVHEIEERDRDILLTVDKDSLANIMEKILEKKIYIEGIQKTHDNLEERFMKMVEGGKEDVGLGRK